MEIKINKIIETDLTDKREDGEIYKTNLVLGSLMLDTKVYHFLATVSLVWDSFSTWKGWVITSVNEVQAIAGASPDVQIKEFKIADHEYIIQENLDEAVDDVFGLKENMVIEI